jgi:hypothetical protein
MKLEALGLEECASKREALVKVGFLRRSDDAFCACARVRIEVGAFSPETFAVSMPVWNRSTTSCAYRG